MVPITRRDALRTAAALLPVAAGCNDVDTGGPTPTPGRRRGPENVAVDPGHVTLRGSGEEPVVWLAESNTDASDHRARYGMHGVVADTRTATRLRFADRVDADSARGFLDDTDFDAETVYVETMGVGECYTLELCYVGWSATEVRTDYGRHLRDVHVRCTADANDTVATLVRIPDDLDPDRIRSHGSGMSSGGCRLPPWIRERAGVSTDATDVTDATDAAGANGTEGRSEGGR